MKERSNKHFLNKEDGAPLYSQMKEIMLEKLQNMPPSTPIPSERVLCEMFGVSRPTVRKTLELLEQEGSLYKLPGKGTFVADRGMKYVDHELNTFIGFYEDVEMQKRKASTKVIQQTVSTLSQSLSETLKVPDDTEIFVLERLRFVDNQPVCLVSSYIPLPIFPNLIKYDFSNDSLYRILKSNGISIHKATRTIEVKRAGIDEAIHLGIEKGEPIMWFESVGYLENGTPFEFVRSRYPAYKVKFATEVFKPEDRDFL